MSAAVGQLQFYLLILHLSCREQEVNFFLSLCNLWFMRRHSSPAVESVLRLPVCNLAFGSSVCTCADAAGHGTTTSAVQ